MGSWAAWGGFWLLVAAVVVLPHMQAFSELSKIDEYQHVDYLAKTQDLEHVEGGELVGQTAMREQACRGIDLEGAVLPPCDSDTFDPGDFPGRGFNHTYSDPPTYYVVTGAAAAVVGAGPGVDGLVTAGRSIGVLWLAGGLWVTFLLARRLGAGRYAAAGATMLLAGTPTVVHSTTTITTDAPLVLVGGLLCLVAVDVAEGRRRWWWLAVAAAVAMAVKSTALPAVGVAVLFLLFPSRTGASRGRRARAPDETDVPAVVPRFRAVAAVVLGALLPTVVWNAYTSATALPSADDIPMGQTFKVDSIGLTQILGSLETTFSPVAVPERAPFLHTMTVDAAVQILNLLLILGVAAVVWFWPLASTAGRMGVATLIGMLATGPCFAVLLFVSLDVSYTIPGRYGLSLLPAAAACLALVASRRRAGESGLVVLGLLGIGVLLGYTLTSA